MDKEVRCAINDLLDIVSTLSVVVHELNPGAVKDFDTVDFLIKRIERNLKETRGK